MVQKRVDAHLEQTKAEAQQPRALGSIPRRPVDFRPEEGLRRYYQKQLKEVSQLQQSDKLPETFDEQKQYRVHLSRPVPVFEHDPSIHMLRPGDDVVVRGDLAQRIRDAIVSAKEV